MDHLLPWLRLQLTPDLSHVGLMHLIEHFKTPGKVLDADGDGWPELPELRENLAALIRKQLRPRDQEACQRLEERVAGYALCGILTTRKHCARFRTHLHTALRLRQFARGTGPRHRWHPSSDRFRQIVH